jgi:di/tricarboxylate transporter
MRAAAGRAKGPSEQGFDEWRRRIGVWLGPAIFLASMAFMLPISTPPNAIVCGTGLVRLPYMLKMGVLMDVVAFFVIFALLRLLCPAPGLA